MPHAKLHLAWLLATGCCIAMYSLCLIWGAISGAGSRYHWIVRDVGILDCSLPGALYGGLFVDPNHEVPSILGLHPNLFAFIFVTGFLIAGLLVEYFRRRTERTQGSL